MRKLTIALFILTGLISCNPDNIEVTEPEQDFEFEIVFENNKESGINIIYMGDAYLESDLDRENGIYRQQAIANINAFFDTHPFSEFRDDFNAYIVYVPSQSNVILTGGEISQTAFGAHWTSDPPTLVVEFKTRINLIVKEITGSFRTNKDLILMSVNHAYGGSAGFNQGLAVFGQGSTGVMMHEVGHGFAGLADEYSNAVRPIADTERFVNLDSTSSLDVVKWKRFIGLNGYDGVGAFEGGGYTSFGIWRPGENSVMRSSGYIYYNAPSREAIIKRICELMNRSCSFEDFLEIDRRGFNRIPRKISEEIHLEHMNCFE